MQTAIDNKENPQLFSSALRFWERWRILYNAVLTVIVVLWVVLSWPHFRPALTLGSLEAFIVLGLMANVCYCAAYLAEGFMRAALPIRYWPRFRVAIFVAGMLLAIVMENYWIADEIYPYASEPPRSHFGAAATIPFISLPLNVQYSDGAPARS